MTCYTITHIKVCFLKNFQTFHINCRFFSNHLIELLGSASFQRRQHLYKHDLTLILLGTLSVFRNTTIFSDTIFQFNWHFIPYIILVNLFCKTFQSFTKFVSFSNHLIDLLGAVCFQRIQHLYKQDLTLVFVRDTPYIQSITVL